VFIKIIYSIVFIAVSSTFAYAADPVPVDGSVVVDEARFDWSGLYFGGTIGKAKSDVHTKYTEVNVWSDPDGNGATYGIYAGYNFA